MAMGWDNQEFLTVLQDLLTLFVACTTQRWPRSCYRELKVSPRLECNLSLM